ncbi:Toll/interleukin-1 receptor-like protein [Glycine soja]
MTKYGAFMSFRGTETCYDIAASLYKALLREGVHTFNDDQSLNIGEPIQPALYNAIEGSRVFYVVISKGYASSIGCLQELARICYCVETSPRRVLPIFYDVDPSERWREALTRVANRSGWVIGNESYCVHIPEMVRKKHLSLLPSTSGIALASSTIMHAIRTYDVFVSFRGLDTRNNFAALLLQALHRNGIDAFNDNVQKQSGCYEKAFLDHEERFRGAKEREQVWRWRKALKQVSHLPCMHIQNELQHLQQAEIEEILQEIINILNSKSSSLPNDDLVGMKSIWISTLDRLRDNKSRNIMNVLQISYDDSEEKD